MADVANTIAPEATDDLLGRFAHKVQNAFTEHGIATAWSVMVFGAFGGYMLTAVPNKILVLWELWPFQFLTCLVTFAIDSMTSDSPLSWLSVIADAFLCSILIQFFVRWTNYNWGDNPKQMFPIYDKLSHDHKTQGPLTNIINLAENYENFLDKGEDEDEDELEECSTCS